MSVPAQAWGWCSDVVEPLAGGLINATYVVRQGGERVAVLQRLHPIFGAEVNLDIEAVTLHLAAKGLETPHLIRTKLGQPWIEEEGRVWRALTWVEGETVHAVPSADWAEAGGALVGRFHRAVADLAHDYRFARAGVHDTAAHLGKLRALVEAGAGDGELRDARDLGREILGVRLPALPSVPLRHVHGDLKISNLLFRQRPVRGACLVDLDTLGRGTMTFELGDAMRSWCNPRGEDAREVRFDRDIFAAAIRGFRAVAADAVSRDEMLAVASGLETVCIELAARFCVDAFEDRYFGWDSARFPSRRAHNLVRARGQLALGLDVQAARQDLIDILAS